jgi:hypothetical protein
MTPKEVKPTRVSSSGAVAKLREEVQEYHLEVKTALATIQANCIHCREQVGWLDLQINGSRPESDAAPGIKKDVDSLKQSRESVRRGFRTLWITVGALTSIVSAVFAWFVPK